MKPLLRDLHGTPKFITSMKVPYIWTMMINLKKKQLGSKMSLHDWNQDWRLVFKQLGVFLLNILTIVEIWWERDVTLELCVNLTGVLVRSGLSCIQNVLCTIGFWCTFGFDGKILNENPFCINSLGDQACFSTSWHAKNDFV